MRLLPTTLEHRSDRYGFLEDVEGEGTGEGGEKSFASMAVWFNRFVYVQYIPVQYMPPACLVTRCNLITSFGLLLKYTRSIEQRNVLASER